MARIRSIKPELRTSITVSMWPREVRYFFVLIWGYLDDYGRGVDDEMLIASDCFPRDRDITPERVDDWLELIADSGPLCRYEVDGRNYLHAPNWREHQKPSHPTRSKVPPCPEDEPDDFKKWREINPQRLPKRSRKSREGFQKIPEAPAGPSGSLSGGPSGATFSDSVHDKERAADGGTVSPAAREETTGQGSFCDAPESLPNPSGDVPEHFVPELGSKGAREQGSKGEGGVGGNGPRAIERSSTPPASRPDGRPPLTGLPDDFALTDTMRSWARNTYPRVDVDHETRKFISHHRGEETRKRNWYEAWKRWIADGNAYLIKHGQPTALPVAAGAENVVDFAARRPSTADQRATAALAVAAELAAEENQ
ncbi:hypothetical protein [Streptomyces sp. NPDC097640]|uniref:hypothetical protein n=1 Tax=Streptomyces sp. NPDC097640 TaxID=3157229 RepID=UPI00331A972A